MIILCDFIKCYNILCYSQRECSYNEYINQHVYLINTIHGKYQIPTLFDNRVPSSASEGYAKPRYLDWHVGLVFICSRRHPEDGTLVPKHLGV